MIKWPLKKKPGGGEGQSTGQGCPTLASPIIKQIMFSPSSKTQTPS